MRFATENLPASAFENFRCQRKTGDVEAVKTWLAFMEAGRPIRSARGDRREFRNSGHGPRAISQRRST